MPNSKTNPSPLERILEEQRAARDYILSGGADQRGAWQGLCDWCFEECMLAGWYEDFT